MYFQAFNLRISQAVRKYFNNEYLQYTVLTNNIILLVCRGTADAKLIHSVPPIVYRANTVPHLGHGYLWQYCILTEGGCAHEVVDSLSSTGEPAGLIWHQPTALSAVFML